MAAPLLEPWRPDLETYHRLAEQGAFGDERLELLDGVITRMSPKGREHEQALAYLTRLAVAATSGDVQVRVQLALSLAEGWEPEPDLALVAPGTPDPYHPATAGLVVEVAASSLRHDREIKIPAYARFAIPECWLLDVGQMVLERYTEPTPEGYARHSRHREGIIASVAFPGLELDVAELTRAAGR